MPGRVQSPSTNQVSCRTSTSSPNSSVTSGQRGTHGHAGDRHGRRCCVLPNVEIAASSDTTCEPVASIRWRRAQAVCLPAKWPSQQCSCLVRWGGSSAWPRSSTRPDMTPALWGSSGSTASPVALLGRNNPAGIAVGALLWAFLDATSDILQVTQTAPKKSSTSCAA